MSRMLFTALALTTVAAACNGSIGDLPVAQSNHNASSADGGTTSSVAAGTYGNMAPLRRLTSLQVTTSVADLFPGITMPTASFPAETVANGFTNNASVQNASSVLVEAEQTFASAVAAAVVASPTPPCKGETPATCGPKFVTALAKRAYRRPLAADEAQQLSDFYTQQLAATNPNVAMRLAIEAVLTSPDFIYRPELGSDPTATGNVPLTSHEIAARLSLLLWNSIPDDALMADADQDRLHDPSVLEGHAKRLLADPRARAAVVSFHEQWLDFDRLLTSPKDPTTFPTFDDALRQSMRTEGSLFIERTIFDGPGTLESLFTSSTTWVDQSLATLYGVPYPGGTGFQKVTLDPTQRAGILGLAEFLTSHAHQVEGSPVLRGVFVLGRILCSPPPPPPPNVNTTPPVAGAGQPVTNRDRYDEHAKNALCASCHTRIDGVGFPFESFDAIGRFRTTDNGAPVDSTGWVIGTTDMDGPVQNAHDLATKFAGSATVRHCVATEWYRYAFGRSELAPDGPNIDAMAQALDAKNGDIKAWLVELVKSPAFVTLAKGQ